MKISIIGGGEIGSHIALWASISELANEFFIIDHSKDKAEGQAMDISQSLALYAIDVEVYGTDDYRHLEGSDIVVIAVGSRRKPGMKRSDLFPINQAKVRNASEKIKQYCPNAIVIVVTNPLDAMTFTAWSVLRNSRKVMGMGNSLDTARYREVIHKHMGLPRSRILCLVQGPRDNDQQEHAYAFQTDEMIQESKNTAINTISKKGSTVFAPSLATVELIASIVDNQKTLIPVSFYHSDSDSCYGEVVCIGKGGIES